MVSRKFFFCQQNLIDILTGLRIGLRTIVIFSRTGALFRGCANYASPSIGLVFVGIQTSRRLRLCYRGSLPAFATTCTYADHCIRLLRAACIIGSRGNILRRINHALIGPCGSVHLPRRTKWQMVSHAPPAPPGVRQRELHQTASVRVVTIATYAIVATSAAQVSRPPCHTRGKKTHWFASTLNRPNRSALHEPPASHPVCVSASHTAHRTSTIVHRTSTIAHRTSNIAHGTPLCIAYGTSLCTAHRTSDVASHLPTPSKGLSP